MARFFNKRDLEGIGWNNVSRSIVKFNNIDGISFVGDVHGEWATLGYKIVEQYKLENYLIVQLGDFGIGFNSEEYNKVELKKLNTKLKKRNNQLVVLRGNHDDPKYFNGEYSGSYSNLYLAPDYTVVEVSYNMAVPDDGIQSTTNYINILLVGGGLSIDRSERRKLEQSKPDKKCYWENEIPVYDESKLDEINKEYPNNIDVVATHTATSFVYPYTKNGIEHWITQDIQLKDDLDIERGTMDKIFNKLERNQQIKEWYYAHFHCTQNMMVNNTHFHLLDICEFREKKL